MSSQIFTLEYQVKLTGGSQAASQMNGVNNAVKMNSAVTTQATKAQQQYGTAQNKVAQQTTGATRNLRALTFGLTGLTSSLVEALGMWGIYSDSAARVEAATKRVADATKAYGESSKEARDATQELSNAERAMNMVRRNTILSFFDMVTWITLTANALHKMRAQGLSLSGVFSGLVGIFNRFRTAAVVPAVTDVTRLGTTFTSFASNTATSMSNLGTVFTSFGTTATAGIGRSMTSLGTTFTTFRGTTIATAATMTGLSTSFKATAGSAIPLAGTISGIGVASGGAAVGVGVLSKALIFLKANIRGVLLATGVGGILVAIGLIAEHFLNAADAAEEGSNTISKSLEEIKTDANGVLDATDALTENMLSGFESTAKGIEEVTQITMDSIIEIAKQSGDAISEVITKTLDQQLKDIQAQRDDLAEKGVPATLFGMFAIPGIDKGETNRQLGELDKLIASIKGRITKLKEDFSPSPIGSVFIPSPAQISEAETIYNNIVKNAVTAAQEVSRLIRSDVLAGNFDTAREKAKLFIGEFKTFGLAGPEAEKALELITNAINRYEDSFTPGVLQGMTTLANTFDMSLNQMLASTKAIQPIMTETMKIMSNLLTQGMDPELVKQKAKEALEAMIPDPEDLQMALHFLDIYFGTFDTFIKDAAKNTKEFAEGQGEEMIKIGQEYEALVSELKGLMNVQDLNMRQLEAMKTLYADNIQVHIDQMLAIKDETTFWNVLSEAQFQAAIAAQEFTFANINITESLENSRKTILARNAAMIEGRIALRDFITDTELATIRDREFETGLRALVAAQTNVRLPTRLTIDQLKELQIELQKGGTGATIFAEAFDEMLAPLERFADISSELAKGGKEGKKGFKDAFKELEIPKDLRNQLKDVLKDLAEVQKLGTKINDTWQALSLIELHGAAEDFDKFINKMSRNLEKMASVDVDLQKFADFMDPIFDSLKDMPDEDRQRVLLALGNVWEELFGPDGTFMDEDATTSDVASGIEKITNALNGMTEVDIEGISGPLDHLAVSIKGLQEAQSNYVASQGFKDTMEAYKALSEGGIIKIPEPPDVQQTLSDNMGNLVTSTDNLKSSVDTLNSTISTRGLTNISDVPGGGPTINPLHDKYKLLKLGFGGDGEEEPIELTEWDFMIMAAQKVAAQIQQIFLDMTVQLSNVWLAMSTTFSFHMNSLAINATSARTQVLTQFLALSGELSNIWLLMATNWSFIMNSMVTNAISARTQIIAQFLAMSGEASNVFLGLATNWSAMMNSMIANAQSASNGVQAQFSSMLSKATSIFNQLASNWSKTMNKMVSTASSAVSRILSQINKLNKTVTTTHKIVTQRVNAARGFQGVVSNPTQFNVAEGGKPEFVSVTPLSDFTGKQTVASQMNVKGAKGNHNGNNIPMINVQVFLDGEQVKGRIAQIMAKDQGSYV